MDTSVHVATVVIQEYKTIPTGKNEISQRTYIKEFFEETSSVVFLLITLLSPDILILQPWRTTSGRKLPRYGAILNPPRLFYSEVDPSGLSEKHLTALWWISPSRSFCTIHVLVTGLTTEKYIITTSTNDLNSIGGLSVEYSSILRWLHTLMDISNLIHWLFWLERKSKELSGSFRFELCSLLCTWKMFLISLTIDMSEAGIRTQVGAEHGFRIFRWFGRKIFWFVLKFDSGFDLGYIVVVLLVSRSRLNTVLMLRFGRTGSFCLSIVQMIESCLEWHIFLFQDQ